MGVKKKKKAAEHLEKRNQSQKLGVELPEGYKEKVRRLKELSKEEQYRILTSKWLQASAEEADPLADSE